jgi:hypothetical protein
VHATSRGDLCAGRPNGVGGLVAEREKGNKHAGLLKRQAAVGDNLHGYNGKGRDVAAHAALPINTFALLKSPAVVMTAS